MFEKKDYFLTWSLGNPFCVVISFLGFEAGYTNTFNSFLVNSINIHYTNYHNIESLSRTNSIYLALNLQVTLTLLR